MDEPFTGLDPVNLVLLREAFMELRDRGRTLVFSTHQMEAAEALCESVAIVDHGRLVAGGRLRDAQAGQRPARRSGSRVDGEPAPAWLAGLPGVVGGPADAGRCDARARCRAPIRPRSSPASWRGGAPVTPLRGRRSRASRRSSSSTSDARPTTTSRTGARCRATPPLPAPEAVA